MNLQAQNEIDVFNAALETAAKDRAAFLDTATAGNAALRNKIDALVAAHERGTDFLDNLAVKKSLPLNDKSDPAAGFEIDNYKVLKPLGEGGCGIVYEAEQLAPVRRPVALKLIKAGMDTKAVIARFEAERQALALMDHPNIAKVFDAGSTEGGRPYFVMELVKGVKITDYCVQHDLTIRDRLNLFLQVCDAVQHAHQKGIIHRDLKPSNILVGSVRGGARPLPSHSDALPKVIDFGIAKAIQGKLTDATIHTGLHQFLGTPAYMSPEQADLSPDIDTRTDIYSLGVLLYELLTGKPPFDNHELLTAGLDEMRRIIREVEPKPPSHLSRNTHHSSTPSDLDWIVMKCLEKERTQRYDTASALASDIERYLHWEPVSARRPTASYRVCKFFVRHKTASLAGAAVLSALLAGAGLATLGFLREHAARSTAEHRLRAALGFVSAVEEKVLPDLEVAVGGAKALESLARSGHAFVQELRSKAADDPKLTLSVAKVLVRLSRVQGSYTANHTGHFDDALRTAEEAVSLLQSANPQFEPALRIDLLAEAYGRVASSLEGAGQPEKALEVRQNLVSPTLQDLRRFPGYERHALDSSIMNQTAIGLDLLGLARPADAAVHLSRLLELPAIRALASSTNPLDWQRLSGLHAPLAFAYERTADWNAALSHATQSIELCDRIEHAGSATLAHRRFRAMEQAVKAYALAELGDPKNALAQMEAAREFVENDLHSDPRSWRARENFCIVFSRQSRGLVALARREPDPDVRRELISRACAAFERTQSVFDSLDPRPRNRSFLDDLQKAREDVTSVEQAPGPAPPGGLTAP